jgi:hypothetical protein
MSSLRGSAQVEGLVGQRVRLPVGRVVVPPLGRHADEAGGQHGAVEAAGLGGGRQRAAAVGAPREVVVRGGQGERRAVGGDDRDVDGGAPAVARAGERRAVGGEARLGDVARVGDAPPELALDRGGAVAVPEEEAALLGAQEVGGAGEALGDGAAEEAPRGRVERRLREVVGGGVADVEDEVRDERRGVDQVGR